MLGAVVGEFRVRDAFFLALDVFLDEDAKKSAEASVDNLGLSIRLRV